MTYPEQKDLKMRLKEQLEAIRAECRERMRTPDDMVDVLENKMEDKNWDKHYYECMKGISLWCSEEMAKQASTIIKESVHILQSTPPCDFTAIAIGSIAKGEATPYSDLEFMFLIGNKTPDIEQYFERLAITVYFLVGNFGETKLSYMAIDELRGWFDDRAKNGFKIDGLADGAGNIPTGNGTPFKHNHFIVTSQDLADRYQHVLNNPVEKEALRGDLTAMLAYMKPFYSHSKNSPLFQNVEEKIKSHTKDGAVNKKRTTINMKMLATDVQKFNFEPSHELIRKGFNADVKRELYRFPAILLLDTCIALNIIGKSSWHSIAQLHDSKCVEYMSSCFSPMMSIATYIRLACYLYHESHDDRMSVAQSASQKAQVLHHMKQNSDVRRWHIPVELYSKLCEVMLPLKECLRAKELTTIEDLSVLESCMDTHWVKVITLYYGGNYGKALALLKELYKTDVCTVEGAKQLTESIDCSRLGVISEILHMSGMYESALVLLQYLTDNKISDGRSRIAYMFSKLGHLQKAGEILSSIEDKVDADYYTLGGINKTQGKYNDAEKDYVQALQIDYSKTTGEPLFDYYGNLIPSDNQAKAKIDFVGMSAEERLEMITTVSPCMIHYLLALGDIYHKQQRHTLASKYFHKCLEGHAGLYGEICINEQKSYLLSAIGKSYKAMGQYTDAENYYRQALAMYRELSQSGVSEAIACVLNNLGSNYKAMGQNSDAEEYYKQALAMYGELLSDSHRQTIASILHNLGDIKKAENSNQHVRKYYKQALSMYDQAEPTSPLHIPAIQDKLEGLKTHKTRRCTIL